MKYELTQILLQPFWLLANNEVANEVAPAPAAEGVGGFVAQFIQNPLNLILVSGILFILLVLRPQQKQMKEMQQKLASLKKNDRIVTTGGIHGTVVQVNSNEAAVVLRIDDNSGARLTINRDAVAKIINSETEQ